jgi:aminopeptidase N
VASLGPVADRTARALGQFEALFGPFPYSRLAISQVPGGFGQGWPELVYLPTLQFLTPEERKEMGLGGQPDVVQDNLQLAHEVAHQWWGNLVGWKTYHDQWLSEGFATYAAALSLATEKDGERKFHELLEEYKRDLLSKNREGQTIESGGPIWLGQRLSNSLNPEGYDAITYKKACWVLHMLRCLMKQPAATQASGERGGSAADEKFFQMLRAFLADYKGQAPSTEDFIHYAERYMTPASDLDHNGKLDWFFNEWVYGTGIPAYGLHATINSVGPGKFVVQGTIDQSEMPAGYEMLVPVIAEQGKEGKVTLGRVAVSESGGSFRFTTTTKPSRVEIDEDEILAVVR